MEACKLKVKVQATGTGLTLTVTLDGSVIYNSELDTDATEIAHEFDDSAQGDRTLVIELSGKTPQHTMVDNDGNIVNDVTVEIKEFHLDDIDLKKVFFEQCRYHHNFNGTQDPIVDTFWGTMGCNGQIRFGFASPVYLWLLENM